MNRTEFYTSIRSTFGPLSQKQVDGIEALLAATEGLPIPHRAYLLATAWHETDETMQPIAEYRKGRGKPYGKPGKYGQAQYGRGYVQLTWDANYERADKALGLNGALLKDFNLAMQPTIAAMVLVRGCSEGWFTARKLSDYLPGDYRNARRVVNGTDKAEEIAGYARYFERAIMASCEAAPLPPIPIDDKITPKTIAKPSSFWARIIAALFKGLSK